jgi:hypothetical protein
VKKQAVVQKQWENFGVLMAEASLGKQFWRGVEMQILEGSASEKSRGVGSSHQRLIFVFVKNEMKYCLSVLLLRS